VANEAKENSLKKKPHEQTASSGGVVSVILSLVLVASLIFVGVIISNISDKKREESRYEILRMDNEQTLTRLRDEFDRKLELRVYPLEQRTFTLEKQISLLESKIYCLENKCSN
tara:strand:+ start:45684 stop:46025 length:342 start_codon:yes stop_codon:yes gene_type:complete